MGGAAWQDYRPVALLAVPGAEMHGDGSLADEAESVSARKKSGPAGARAFRGGETGETSVCVGVEPTVLTGLECFG